MVKDDLYVEIEYHPNALYLGDRWTAHLRTDNPRDYSVGGYVYGFFEWTVRWKGRRLIAQKRRQRLLEERARQYGKKVIR